MNSFGNCSLRLLVLQGNALSGIEDIYRCGAEGIPVVWSKGYGCPLGFEDKYECPHYIAHEKKGLNKILNAPTENRTPVLTSARSCSIH